MNIKKINIVKISGIIIAICGGGIMGLNYYNNSDLESYTLPVILVCLSVIFIFQKKKN